MTGPETTAFYIQEASQRVHNKTDPPFDLWIKNGVTPDHSRPRISPNGAADRTSIDHTEWCGGRPADVASWPISDKSHARRTNLISQLSALGRPAAGRPQSPPQAAPRASTVRRRRRRHNTQPRRHNRPDTETRRRGPYLPRPALPEPRPRDRSREG